MPGKSRVPHTRKHDSPARDPLKIVELFGTIDYDPAYDYKAERRQKHRRTT
jgi:hypothetical protein